MLPLMSEYQSFQSNAAEAPLMRKWIFWALIISLSLHAGLFVAFKMKKLDNFVITDAPVLAPMPVNMKRAVIPMIEEKETRVKIPEKEQKTAITELTIPADRPEIEDVIVAPQFTDLSKIVQSEKPKADLGGMDALVKAEQKSRGDLDRELNSLADNLIKNSVRAVNQPTINLPAGKIGGGGLGTAEGIPGLKSMSDLLGETGTLKSGTRGGIPGGALFEHGSAELRDAAVTQLQKLGELIRKNPRATFVIEGHTDSTGTPERNQVLSEERAQSVKDWLVETMGISPERIETVGLGSTRMIVPPEPYDITSQASIDAEIARQQPNRRVEIVVRMNRR
jgi:outer membrane protein OmpA-like peptidoglycan-associated protein